MGYRVLLTVLLLFCTAAAALQAQGIDTTRGGQTTEGREFWVVFQKNFRDYKTDAESRAQVRDSLLLQLFITSGQDASGVIEVEGIGYRREFNVPAGTVLAVNVDTAAQLRSSESVEELAVHIVSDVPVAVYGLSRRYQTTDTYLGYPVNVLGTRYRAMGYQWLENDLLSQMAVIATMDDTEVTITPNVRTQKGKAAGKPFSVTLDRGETYQVIPRYDPRSDADLTGTLIESDKPVAVFSGHNCAYVPDRRTMACNLLVEQIPPTNSWGRQFFVGTLAGRSSSVLRVLANEDDTEVFENNRLVARLQAGEYYENKNQVGHGMITSNNPVLVAQFSKGFANGDSVGDPMMIVVAPTEQFLTQYRFATPVQGSWHHYVNLIVPTAAINSLKLDGRSLDPQLFSQLGISRYSIAQIEVAYGTHTLTCSQPFGLYSYGFGYAEAAYDAYGNGGGQLMESVRQREDTLAPTLDARNNRRNGSIESVVRDDRLNDRGVDQVTILDSDNLDILVAEFVRGAPQVAVTLRPRVEKRNAYARFRLTDRADNVGAYTLCARYDEIGDSLQISILRGDESCDFSEEILFGGFLKYSGIDNNVTIAAESALNNPVPLKGNHGRPAFGIGGYVEYPYSKSLYLTGRLGFDIWTADVTGYWPEDDQPTAPDGTRIVEEFLLDRSSFLLTIGAGAQWYFLKRNIYLFGLANISLPLSTSEEFSRSILSPTNYTYNDGSQKLIISDNGGDFGLIITPEIGIGFSADIPGGWQAFSELGLGTTLTSIAPEHSWNVSYLLARFGGKVRW